MLVSEFDVIVVSAFRQSLWLAAELQRQKLRTLVVDLSSKMGMWPAEDLEGPFGFFKTENIKGSYLEYVQAEESFHEVPNGFTLWLGTGPLEFKGPLIRYQLERLGLSAAVLERLSREKDLKGRIEPSARQLKFESEWPVPLANQMASTTFKSSLLSTELPRCLPLLSPFFIRWATRVSNEKSFEWLRSKGVVVTDKTEVIDVSLKNKRALSGLELKGEFSGLLKCTAVVWSLGSEESYFYNNALAEKIYSHGPIESEWSWVRYRIKFAPNNQTLQLPLHFCSLLDKDSPWTHDNLVLWQKTTLDDFIDAWVRLPTVQRFNKNYLEMFGEKICSCLKERLEGVEPTVHDYPQEYTYTYHQVGPTRFPVYNTESLKKRKAKAHIRNLFLDSNELMDIYSHESRQDRQDEALKGILGWKVEQDLKKRRETNE